MSFVNNLYDDWQFSSLMFLATLLKTDCIFYFSYFLNRMDLTQNISSVIWGQQIRRKPREHQVDRTLSLVHSRYIPHPTIFCLWIFGTRWKDNGSLFSSQLLRLFNNGWNMGASSVSQCENSAVQPGQALRTCDQSTSW